MCCESLCNRCGAIAECIGDPPVCSPCWHLRNTEAALASERLARDTAVRERDEARADANALAGQLAADRYAHAMTIRECDEARAERAAACAMLARRSTDEERRLRAKVGELEAILADEGRPVRLKRNDAATGGEKE